MALFAEPEPQTNSNCLWGQNLSITNLRRSTTQTGKGSPAENFSELEVFTGGQALCDCLATGKLFLLQGNCLPINLR